MAKEWWTSSTNQGEVEIFIVMVHQQRTLTSTIYVVGLGKNKGVRLHVREPSKGQELGLE